MFTTEYEAKRVAVIGLAVSNTPLIRYLKQQGAKLTVCDQKLPEALSEYLNQLADLNLEYRLGPAYLDDLTGFDYIFVTPGMRRDLPQFEAARARGTVFSSEMELFFQKCPGRIIGITGSSGKTTTTTLIGLILAASGFPSFVGGNIGKSLLDRLGEMSTSSLVVLELSSFQLQELRQSPQVAVITNITPNHLDRHASMDEYLQAKLSILNYQGPQDWLILNYDNPITRNLADRARGRAYYFSRQESLAEGAFLEGDQLCVSLAGRTERLLNRSDLKLLGEHNLENVLTAALVTRLLGAAPETIAQVAREFRGVEHRLELVRELNGVKYYNDSIATTPDRAMAGLAAMVAPTILIAGGYDKKLPFTGLAERITKSCKQLLVLGATAPQIREAVQSLQPDFPITSVTDLAAAVSAAREMAVPGEVVLLSPACASYDMFHDFQERGRLFKKLVNDLN